MQRQMSLSLVSWLFISAKRRFPLKHASAVWMCESGNNKRTHIAFCNHHQIGSVLSKKNQYVCSWVFAEKPWRCVVQSPDADTAEEIRSCDSHSLIPHDIRIQKEENGNGFRKHSRLAIPFLRPPPDSGSAPSVPKDSCFSRFHSFASWLYVELFYFIFMFLILKLRCTM